METQFNVTADFEAVFLINGALSETAVFRFDPNDVLYITVLPLEAHLLPYTVKFAAEAVRSNTELVVYARLPRGHYLRLLPRYAYMYDTAARPAPHVSNALPCRFFDLVKAGNLIPARALLTPELNGSVSDADLTGFFDGFNSILETDGSFYLVRSDGVATEYAFTFADGRIDNVEEVQSGDSRI